MYRFGWLSPLSMLTPIFRVESGNPNNYTGWRNKDYDALLANIARLEPGSAERQRLIDRAQRILVEDAVAVVPVFHYVQNLIVATHVRDLWVNGMGMVDYMKIRMKN